MIPAPTPYQAPAWLPGAHAQTLWPLLIKPRPLPLRRERWTTPDGDFIDVDHLDGPPDAPLLVLFHGLEGSARSHYAISTAHACRAAGWRLALPHFRGCSGELNQQPRAYHAGDSDEVDWILQRLQAANGGRRLHAAGVSLGDNALLKWAGERGSGAAERVTGVVAFSAPFNFTACGHHLANCVNLLYTRHFLATLKLKAEAQLRRWPDLFDASRMRQAINLYQFDDAVTAPVHGFADADDYWQSCSAENWLPAIAVPALAAEAQYDPFLAAGCLPTPRQASPWLRLEQPATGGHVGFVSGDFPGRLDWLPNRLLHFFLFETS